MFEGLFRPRLVGGEADGEDAPALHLLHGPFRPTAPERVARCGDLPQHRVYVASHGVVVARLLDRETKSRVELFEREARVNARLMVVEDDELVLFRGVVLVTD